MVTATISQTQYAPPQTITGCASAVNTAFISAGMGNPIDTWVASNGDYHYTYQVIGNANATKGSTILDVTISNNSNYIGQVFTTMYDTWNTTNHIGTNPNNGYAYGRTAPNVNFTNGQIITFTSINHPELKVVSILQPSYGQYWYGIIRPANKPSWWDENVYPYFFMNTTYSQNLGSGDLLFFLPAGNVVNPYNNGNALTYMTNGAISSGNPVNGKRDILNGIILTAPYNSSGIAGRLSNDVALLSAVNTSFLDVFAVTVGSEEYTLISPPGANAVGIRTV